MKAKEIDRALQEADPASSQQMAQLKLDPAEAALAEAIVAESGDDSASQSAAMPWPSAGRRRGLLGLAGMGVAAATLAALLLLGGGASESPSRAYGAEVVRFAESTPLLLLEGPGWRVQSVYEAARGPYEPRGSKGEGSMEFATGKPIPNETLRVTGNEETGQYASGMAPAAVRQRKVELAWRHGSLEQAVAFAHQSYHSHGQRWTEAPVLETTAQVDTRAEVYINQGGPGDRQMAAYWSEDGYLLEMRAAVPNLSAFKERLDWLTKVDSQTWLDAMPAKVIKAADRSAAVRDMLKGIPVPGTFKPSRIPDEGLTTDRYQVGAAVTGTVACLWFRQWGAARRTGDRAAAAEAERAMATSRHWTILHEMAKDGDYPKVVWELAAAMPSGRGRRGWRLLPQAEGLGCAREGIPVLPRKQRLQRAHGFPPPR